MPVALSSPRLRRATDDDVPAVTELMRESVLAVFPAVHSAAETASAARFITVLDPLLIEDGTYFVHEADGRIVACGGWSRRAKLYAGPAALDDDARLLDPLTEAARVRAMFVRAGWTRRGLARALLAAVEADARREGFRELVLMATLPGVPLYRASGFTEAEPAALPLPDGVTLTGVLMRRSL